MKEKELVKLRKKVYQLLKVNDATNKVSWWNLSDDVVDLIVSERERVIGEVMKYVNNKQFASTDYDTNLLVQSMMKTIRSELFNKLKRKDE